MNKEIHWMTQDKRQYRKKAPQSNQKDIRRSPGIETDWAHMKRVPTLISMFDALKFTPGARLALEMALAGTALAYGEEEVFFAEEEREVSPKPNDELVSHQAAALGG